MLTKPGRGFAKSLVRRATPPLLVPAVVRLRTRRVVASRAAVATARLHMRFLLERTRPDLSIEDAAERYLEWMAWRDELRWHPRSITCQPVTGLEHLAEVREGAVLSFMHHGQYDGVFASLARSGVRLNIVANPRHLDSSAPAWLRQQIRLVAHGGSAIIPVTAGSQEMTDRLVAGSIVAIASDVAGRTPISFAGRQVLGSAGAARIAWSAGRPVVVMTSHPGVATRTRLHLHEPLHPADFASAEALLAALLEVHESAVLAWPEAHDQPSRRFAVPGPEGADFPPPIE